MNVCKKNCSHDPNKLVDLIMTAKILYQRLVKDVCIYAKELQKFQDYYQRFDLNNDTMLTVMMTRLEKMLVLFYAAFVNHLSVTTSVRGLGEKVIKPVRQEYGTSTTIRYQNICKTCTECSNSCEKSSSQGNKYISCRDLLKVQTTINIATYDNISITLLTDDDVFLGYTITVGKLSYDVLNYNGLTLKHTVVDENVQSVEKLTTDSIETLFEFADDQIKILADVEASLVANIEFIDKYLKKLRVC